MKHNCDVTNVVEVQQCYLNSTILPVSPPSGTVQTLSIDELNKNLIVVPKLQCSNKSLNDWVKSISEDLMVLDIKLFTAGFEVRMEYRIGGLEVINYYSGKSFNSLQDINTLFQYKKNNDNKDEDDDVIILGDNLGDNKVEENAGVTITGDNFII
ncbi:MAG: hypothetical protein HRU35_07935 [Rickettsiaceae bacterium]|nr:hypothetical protein [Rickettsiaceae bacterium]